MEELQRARTSDEKNRPFNGPKMMKQGHSPNMPSQLELSREPRTDPATVSAIHHLNLKRRGMYLNDDGGQL
jgi:hypothetical protein